MEHMIRETVQRETVHPYAVDVLASSILAWGGSVPFLNPLAFWATKMGKKYWLTAGLENCFDRRDDPINARCVGHNAVIDRHVDIDTRQNALSRECQIIQ